VNPPGPGSRAAALGLPGKDGGLPVSTLPSRRAGCAAGQKMALVNRRWRDSPGRDMPVAAGYI